ncbi:DNA-directed RNA polymerase III subunit RPC3 [Porphyridium purpureum]|uniref:DNA-directed RNA polymerase III subunit RPC3 n=1 Tax=Porphyridium purpureum TaxID=35688 RepID=A0A5J4YVA9_PORPP|nr:DNA-directed RNA polymerase III subunit RPC3 [Porphyridium purpureum]|eukprot:POR3531..scf209_3
MPSLRGTVGVHLLDVGYCLALVRRGVGVGVCRGTGVGWHEAEEMVVIGIELAVAIVRIWHGLDASHVVHALLVNDELTVRQLVQVCYKLQLQYARLASTRAAIPAPPLEHRLTRARVAEQIKTLVRHGLVQFRALAARSKADARRPDMAKPRQLRKGQYRADAQRVLALLRYPMYARVVERRMGADAKRAFLELLKLGMASANDLCCSLSTDATAHEESILQLCEEWYDSGFVYMVADSDLGSQKLVDERDGDGVFDMDQLDSASLLASGSRKRSARHVEDSTQAWGTKKRRLSVHEKKDNRLGTRDTTTVWRPNIPVLDALCTLDFVEDCTERDCSREAALVLRELMLPFSLDNICQHRVCLQQEAHPFEIFHADFFGDKNMQGAFLENDVLEDGLFAGHALSAVETQKAVSALCEQYVGHVTRSRHGVHVHVPELVASFQLRALKEIVFNKFPGYSGRMNARRLFEAILEKKAVEQKYLSEMCMLPLKQSNELLYRMFERGFLVVNEVPTSADMKGNRNYFLWRVDLKQSYRAAWNLSMKALFNLIYVREGEVERMIRRLDSRSRHTAAAASDSNGKAVQTPENLSEWDHEDNILRSRIADLTWSILRLNDSILLFANQ